MPLGLRDHPLRRTLTDEVHARPSARLSAPLRATHLAMLSGEKAAAEDRTHVRRLCAEHDVEPPTESDNHLMADFGTFQLKWERHTEFSTYTFFHRAEAEGEPFARSALQQVPQAWVEALPGDLLVGIHLELEPRRAPQRDADSLAWLFGTDNFAGSLVSGDAAAVWTDFALHDDGFSRILLHDRHLRPRQAGRLVQRLCEIETYRMMALLAFPLARRHGGDLTDMRRRLTDITTRMTEIGGLEDERSLLSELTRLSGDLEAVMSATVYRFNAARAYYAIVQRRCEQLRENRIEGVQTIGEFLDRRLAPAMNTCEAVAYRLGSLSDRVSRTSDLLRTRVGIELEAQNTNLLRSMDRRARLQLRLQQTVEGLSVAAISYYLVSLVSYAAKALKSAGTALDVDVVTGLAIPAVVVLVALGVRRLRRLVARDARRAE